MDKEVFQMFMKKITRKIHIFLIKVFYFIFFPFHVFKQKIIYANDIELWVETFG